MTATLASTETVAPADAGIPFARLLRVEWGKATDTRAARWLIGITAAATVLIMLAPVFAKNSVDQTYESYLGFAAFTVATLLPVVAILTLTTEWSQRTVLTTFTQEPRRTRVIRAKVAVAGLLTIGAIVFGAVVSAVAIGLVVASGRSVTNDLALGDTTGFALFILVNIMMGVAFGALLHNTAGSIVLFFLLPTVFGVLGSAVRSVGNWIDPSTTFNWLLTGDWGGHAARIAVSVLLWLVIPLAAGLVRTARREIS